MWLVYKMKPGRRLESRFKRLLDAIPDRCEEDRIKLILGPKLWNLYSHDHGRRVLLFAGAICMRESEPENPARREWLAEEKRRTA